MQSVHSSNLCVWLNRTVYEFARINLRFENRQPSASCVTRGVRSWNARFQAERYHPDEQSNTNAEGKFHINSIRFPVHVFSSVRGKLEQRILPVSSGVLEVFETRWVARHFDLWYDELHIIAVFRVRNNEISISCNTKTQVQTI